MKRISNFSGLKVYFIGIGGISMSGLALILKSLNCEIAGSDLSIENPEVVKLKSLGIKVYCEHNAKNIEQDIDLVVYTSAIKDNNPELCRARELNIPTLERAEVLGLVSRQYGKVIAVSGTHGKTTTTALIGEIFTHAGLNPTIHIGGVSVNLGSNTVVGGEQFFILEACEYCNSFRYIPSDTAVITNIEADHLDYYKDLQEIRSSFEYFASMAETLVADSLYKINHKDKIVIGKDWEARNIRFSNLGYDYDVYYEGILWGCARLNLLGKHNIINSLFAIAVAVKYGIEKDLIIGAINKFRGVERRSEEIYRYGDIPVIIDYAHHPTEIKASITAFGEVYSYPLVIFQPHTYSRTLALFDDFVGVLGDIENLILFPTYPAREEEISGGRAIDLAEKLLNSNYIEELPDLINVIEQKASSGSVDCVLVLGAGDLAEKLKNFYKEK